MAYEPRVIGPTYRTGYNGTGSDIAAYVAVNLVTTPTIVDQIEVANSKTLDAVWGVTAHAIADGTRGDVQTGGICKMLSGAAIAVTARVTVDASGRAVTAATGEGVCGIAKTAASGAAQVIEVELTGSASAAMP